MDNESLQAIYNFRAVDARLATSGQPTGAQLAAAARSGIQCVINLALHDDPRYSLPDERATVESLGMTYVHIPVQFRSPLVADFIAFTRAMTDHASDRLLVHCAANMRVTAFLGLYRVTALGWPRESAFELMRSVWEPDTTWQSFIETILSGQGAAAEAGRAQ